MKIFNSTSKLYIYNDAFFFFGRDDNVIFLIT